MGNTTYFVTQTYVNNEVNTEATARNNTDDSISSSIKSLESSASFIQNEITNINKTVNDLKSDVNSRIGTTPFDAFLKFPSDYIGTRSDGTAYALTTPKNIREGLNAVSSILKNHLSTYNTAALQTVANLSTTVDAYKADYDTQVARIDAIIALAPVETIGNADVTVDTFKEVVDLINQLKNSTTGGTSAFETYQTNINALIATKASNLQDKDTTTRYKDASLTNTYYKLFITGGQLAIEDVPLV